MIEPSRMIGETRRIDVGGYALASISAGTVAPTVVLEAGLGSPAGIWEQVFPAVSSFARVLAYDRAGLGSSDRGPVPRTSEMMVQDLHRLLDDSGSRGPYVLVGHSLGGFTVRLYADRYPTEIAGMVLLDCSHPDQTARFMAALPREQVDEDLAMQSLRAELTRFPPNSEGIDINGSAAQVQRTRLLPDVPLVVLTAGWHRWPAGVPEPVVAQVEQTWRALQGEMARLSGNSVHLIARDSGHGIHHQQPTLVIEAIRQVVLAARGSGQLYGVDAALRGLGAYPVV